MIVEVPMLPVIRPVYDDEDRLLISDSEHQNILRTLNARGFMLCMMGRITHDVGRGVWLVHMAEN